jgi:hypothetical protein
MANTSGHEGNLQIAAHVARASNSSVCPAELLGAMACGLAQQIMHNFNSTPRKHKSTVWDMWQ